MNNFCKVIETNETPGSPKQRKGEHEQRTPGRQFLKCSWSGAHKKEKWWLLLDCIGGLYHRVFECGSYFHFLLENERGISDLERHTLRAQYKIRP